MEELQKKLEDIRNSIDEIERVNQLIERQSTFLNYFDSLDKIDKEVV